MYVKTDLSFKDISARQPRWYKVSLIFVQYFTEWDFVRNIMTITMVHYYLCLISTTLNKQRRSGRL